MSRHKNRNVESPPPGMRFMMEKSMRELTGENKADIHSRAQELAFEAMGAESDSERVLLAVRAALLDPQCTDAMGMLAELIDDPDEYIEVMRLIVQRAADTLGPRYFADNKGYFWGLLETRPYMRARMQLAQALDMEGKLDETIAEIEGMLELNPSDNQGVRYRLLALYIETEKLDPTGKLLAQYHDDVAAHFAWLRLLSALVKGDTALAESELTKAREVNKHVEGYLTGKKRLPDKIPDHIGFGDVSEAIATADDIGEVWMKHPRAMRWLKEHETPKERKGKR
jgi:hypothetical protein